MACASNIQSFLNLQLSYPCYVNGYWQNYSASILDLARWVSYQSYIDSYSGSIPVSVIVAQWGNETGWGTSGLFKDGKNLAGMKFTCDSAITRCGDYYVNNVKFAVFCNYRDAVRAYSQLLRIGYQHVASAASNGEGSTPAGYKAACIALGQGFRSGFSFSTNYCTSGTTAVTFSSSNPRKWDAAGYTTINQPGSILYNTIAQNDCLYNLGVQTTDPRIQFC